MMERSGFVVCIGELLIDFFCTDIDADLTKGEHFVKQAGGAPANVAAAIAKLGGKSALIGKVGNDPFGQFLIHVLDDVQVDTTMIAKDDDLKTTLAFVSLKAGGERDFVFYRGADEKLTMADIDVDKLMASTIMHFGSATALLGGSFRETYFALMELAKENGIFVSFDPNFRTNLWQGREPEFIELARKGIAKADFVKVSDEELRIITGKDELPEGVRMLHELGGRVIAVTLGKAGTLLSVAGRHSVVPSVPIASIDSTGAGDAFVGATLFQLSRLIDQGTLRDDFAEWKKIVSFSNKVGAIVCTKVGAIAALPTWDEAERFAV